MFGLHYRLERKAIGLALGIIQGLMWRTYNESGTLAYSFVDSLIAMRPYYIARAVGGLLFLIGALIGCYKGMHCREGAEGVGRATTEAVVYACITILISNFFLTLFLTRLLGA